MGERVPTGTETPFYRQHPARRKSARRPSLSAGFRQLLLLGCALHEWGVAQPLPQGGYAEAEQRLQQLRQKVKSNPDDYLANLDLATILHQMDAAHPDGGTRVPEAVDAYRRAVDAAPTLEAKSGVLSNLGVILMAAARLDEALDTIKESIRLVEEDGLKIAALYAGAYFNMGKLLGMMGKGTEAQETYAMAEEVARDMAPGTWAKSLAAQKKLSAHQVADVEEALLFLDLVSGGVAASSSEAEEGGRKKRRRRKKSGDPDELRPEWGWLEGISPLDRSWLHFALFSTYNSQGKHEKAWAHLDKGNKLQRKNINYDVDSEYRLLETLQSVFISPDMLRGSGEVDLQTIAALEYLLSGKAGAEDQTPIFVVGVPRSGSTLVEQILAAHPQVFGAGEDTAFAPQIPSILRALEVSDMPALAEVGRQYVSKMQAKVPQGRSVTRIVDKMLRNAWAVGYIMVVLPRACIIHAVRHPLDVALSCYAQPFEGSSMPWAWNLTEIGVQIETTHDIMHHWDALFPDRILRVPYERLVADQEGVSRQMLEHCGLDWDPNVLNFHSVDRPVQTASLGQVRQKLYTSAVGQWKHYEPQLMELKKNLGALIEEYEQEAGLVLHDEL